MNDVTWILQLKWFTNIRCKNETTLICLVFLFLLLFSLSIVVIELVLIASAFSSIWNALPQTNSRFVYKTLRHSYRLLIFNQSCCFYSTAKLSTPIWLWVVYVFVFVCRLEKRQVVHLTRKMVVNCDSF